MSASTKGKTMHLRSLVRTKGLAAALAASLVVTLAAPASAASTADVLRARLAHDRIGDVVHVAGLRDLGREAANAPVRVALLMRVQHEAELQQLVAMQATPRSAYFRHWLSSDQFRSYFSPDAATYARTVRLMQLRGFHITQTYANRGMIRATMPSGLAERYFKTEIHAVYQPNVGVRYLNTKPISVPDELSAVAASVVGLHSVVVMKTDHVFRPARHATPEQARAIGRAILGSHARNAPATANLVAHEAHPDYFGATPNPYKTPAPISTTPAVTNPNPDATIAPDSGTTDYTNYMALGPGVFAGGYDFPVMHGYGGKGQGVATLLDGDYLDTDAKLEFTTFGVPRPTTTDAPASYGMRVYTDGTPYTTMDAGGAGETTLDAETIMSLAPSANYYLYLEPSFDDEGLTASYEKIVSDNLVGVVSSSFGSCETDDPAFGYQTNYIAMEGSAEGITFSASTGDTGGGGCGVYATNGAPQSIKAVSIPSSDLYFTAVGGTDYLYVAGVDGATYPTAGENGWTFGGGGVSVIVPLPPWQAKTTNVLTTGRNTPDVSFVADPDPPSSGEVIFSGGSAEGSGGTSLSSPVFAALQTEINEMEGTRNGWVNPRLYAIDNAQGYYAFHDVATGDNVFYMAGTGYDNVTGIGSIDGFKLGGEE